MKRTFGLVLNEKDNVATALSDIQAGDAIEIINCKVAQQVILTEEIPYGYKFTVQDIRQGEAVIKYGEIIGLATEDIKIGSMVHIHNVNGQRARGDLKKN